MAFPPPSSICHHFRFGLRSLSSGSIFGWSLFFCSRRLGYGAQALLQQTHAGTLRRSALRIWRMAAVPIERLPTAPSGQIVGHRDRGLPPPPGRRLTGRPLRRAGLRAPLIPSSGALLVPRHIPPIRILPGISCRAAHAKPGNAPRSGRLRLACRMHRKMQRRLS